MSTDPKISIITVSFNQGDFIRQNIEAVLNQNYPNIEHIIIDGGSTDNTLDILKSYPHLVWVSEPDRGQSHALNKGFNKATGEYLGWINSDDWYEPNVIREVVEALKESPVVMGACEKSDRHGKPIEVNPNVPRSFFDILKYWVMFSTPDQPGVFFRKSVLEDVQLAPGVYLDEELDYCMDVELWLRISRKYEFKKQVGKLTSHFRAYEDSKTGGNMAAAYRETSRVYVRHAATFGNHDRCMSAIIPVKDLDSTLGHTIDSLARQVFQDLEVLVVDYGNSPARSRVLKKTVVDLGESYKNTCIRYTKAWANGAEEPNALYAINSAIESAGAPLLICLEPGMTVPPDFTFQANNIFRIDPYGLALPFKNQPAALKQMSTPFQGQNFFNVSSIFDCALISLNFVARKVALIELGGFKSWQSPLVAMRELLLRLSHKSWSISIDNPLNTTRAAPAPVIPFLDPETFAILSNYINAKIISEVHAEFLADPFAETRAKNGINLKFNDQVVNSTKRILGYAPSNWESLKFAASRESLTQTTQQHPDFAPGWFLLSQNFKVAGDQKSADEIYKDFLKAREKEAISVG